METIRTWAVSLCMVALGCAVVQMLIPSNGLGRVFRLVLSAFFLCALLTPLFSLASLPKPASVSQRQETQQTLEAAFRERLTVQVNEALTERVGRILDSYGWQAEKIEADMYIAETGDIYMRRVMVYLDRSTMKQATAIRGILQQQLKTPVSLFESG